MGESINTGDTELWVEQRGEGPTSFWSRASVTPSRPGRHSSKGFPTATG
jgi:hypothetical protein